MPCFYPLQGWRSALREASGKRKIVFNPQVGLSDQPVTVPCGQCYGCRLERSRQWAIRCHHESTLWENNAFVTLTYNDDHLPDDGSLDVRHLQLFMKRLRKKTPDRIRFFACGEYGEKLRRPHYHICLFNYDPPDKELHKVHRGERLFTSESLEETWGKGFTLSGNVTFQSAAYVARYIMKKITGESADDHYKNDQGKTLRPEFTVMSRKPGIGKGWWDKWSQDVSDGTVVINGKKVRAPKYYDRQYELVEPEKFAVVRRNRKKAMIKRKSDNTSSRLRVKETVLKARTSTLHRNLEKEQ